jgi:hypothetical protein
MHGVGLGTSLGGFNLGSGGRRASSSGSTGALHVEVILLGDESIDAWADGDEEDDSLRGDDLRCVADWQRRRPQRGRLRHSERHRHGRRRLARGALRASIGDSGAGVPGGIGCGEIILGRAGGDALHASNNNNKVFGGCGLAGGMGWLARGGPGGGTVDFDILVGERVCNGLGMGVHDGAGRGSVRRRPLYRQQCS